MQSTRYLVSEFFLLFILLPVSLALNYSIYIKAGLVLIGFAYIIYVLKRIELVSFRIKKDIDWIQFWRRTLIGFVIVASVTIAYVLYRDPKALFFVPLNKPLLFVIILFVYTLLSVWPQELIYRTFFFNRYERLFKSTNLFLFVNAIVFMLAHIFFRNTLVLVLTFLGGLIFGLTYFKFRSTFVVSIEHALYGNWLFTVGMGQMLAFPGMGGPS
ncbi:MAG: CPBP family intramembrane metalloprotease [Flavobacteriaceae bacterium]|nr:CPBP family intramembrane metalloprotease [Flavobacteriaceae bacterium]